MCYNAFLPLTDSHVTKENHKPINYKESTAHDVDVDNDEDESDSDEDSNQDDDNQRYNVVFDLFVFL